MSFQEQIRPKKPPARRQRNSVIAKIQTNVIIPKIGDVVLLSKTIATVMYVGPVHWNNEINKLYVGVELPEAIPNGHNGTYDQTQYFECKSGHGILLPVKQINKIIKPQELLSKLSFFKQKLSDINTENAKIKQRIVECKEQELLSNDSVIVTHQIDYDENASYLNGILLEKNGKICKVQLKDINGNLTDKIIAVDQEYIQLDNTDY